MKSTATTAAASAALTAAALTAAAMSLPSLWPKPKPAPQPTFSAVIPIAAYTEQLPDGRIVGSWYSYARGQFDMTTGAVIPLSPTDAEWDRLMASMYGDIETPRYEVTVSVPLPKPEQLQPLRLTIDGVSYRWDGKKWVQE